MGNDQYLGPDDEQEAAKRRIEEITGGGAPAPGGRGESLDDVESDAVARARGRASSARARLGMGGPAEEEPPSRARVPGRATAAPVGRRALVMIGGLVGIGILVVLLIVALADGGGGGLPFFPTATPTPTITPTPTPTPTATPTPTPPQFDIPGLECIFSSSAGNCLDYCRQPVNATACSEAQASVERQGADWETFLQCLATPGRADPLDCMREAWYAAQPWSSDTPSTSSAPQATP